MFKNRTGFTKEMFWNTAKINLRAGIWLFLIMGVALLAIAIVNGINSDFLSASVVGLISIFFLSLSSSISKSEKKQYGSAMFAGEPVYEYSFDKDYMKIQFSSDTLRSSQIAKWSILVRVVETKAVFLLFVKDNQFYPVDKTQFSKGSAEELRMLIKEMCPAIPYKITNK